MLNTALVSNIRKNLLLPCMDRLKETRTLNLFNTLIQTQWISRADLERLQFNKLKKLLIHAYENVPYYTNVFRKSRFDPYSFSSITQMQDLPVLTKEIVRNNFDDLQARNCKAFAPRLRATGGSTGDPLYYYHDAKSHSCAWACNWLAFYNNGFNLGEPVINFGGSNLEIKDDDFKKNVYFKLMGLLQFPASPLSATELSEYIAILKRRSDVRFLYGYPSAIYLLARKIIKDKISTINFDAVFTTSEVLHDYQRKVISKAFNADVVNTYGNNESTLYAFECEAGDGLHYAMEVSFLEVLDDTDKQLPEYISGRIIATSLANYAMPFIRYDTGDIGAYSSEVCSCGRSMHRIINLKGRTRDYIISPTGRQIHGSAINDFILSFNASWIVRCLVQQKQIDQLIIRITTDGKVSRERINLLKKSLRENFSNEFYYKVILDQNAHMTLTGKQKIVESFLEPKAEYQI